MWFSLLLSLPLVQDAPAPEAPQAETAPAAVVTPIFSIDSRGVEAWLVDGKDAGLLAALQLLDDRLLELPGEIPDMDLPPGVLEMVIRLLNGPASLTVGMNSEPIPSMPMPLVGELRLTRGSAENAQQLVRDVVDLIGKMGPALTEPAAGEAWTLPTPVPFFLGAHDDGTYLRFGLPGELKARDMSHMLPEGAVLSSGGMLDYGMLVGIAAPMIGGHDPVMQEILDLAMVDAIKMEWATGTDAERRYTVINMIGYGAAMQKAGLISLEELDPTIVSAIPADSTWAVASTMNFGGIVSFYEKILKVVSGDEQLSFQGLLSEVSDLGLEKDILGFFGGQLAMYASDTTGGGGALSTVALLELADRAAFLRSLQRLEQTVAALGAEHAEGYIRLSHMDHDGLDLTILTFPGLPIPLELTLATTETYAVLGASPAAVVAVVGQVHAGSNRLLDNPYFQDQLPRTEAGAPDMSGVLSITFINTPRLMQEGYSLVSLACSALSNAVRSPSNLERSAGLVMPTYGTLQKGAKAMVSVARISGEDLRSEMRSDRSFLVNATGTIGYFGSSLAGPFFLASMLAGIAAPEVVQNLERIEEMKREPTAEAKQEHEVHVAVDQVKSIREALTKFALLNDGNFPEDLQMLVTPDVNGATYLDAASLIDPWGNAIQYEAPNDEHAEPLVWTE